MNPKLNKYITSSQGRTKFKKQCLKVKNILFENDFIQIGCKMAPFYDFYSSKNYLQMQIFVGNKTQKKIQNFSLHYKGTPNLQLYLQKKACIIPENTQYKERSIICCKNYSSEILLLLDFSSEILTLKSTPIPINLYSFFSFVPQNSSTIPLTSSLPHLTDMLSSRYDYTEQIELTGNIGIFKKGLVKDIPKFFTSLIKHTENLYAGEFTLEDLTDEYVLVLVVKDEMKLKGILCGKQYEHFEIILQQLKYLIGN